MQNEPSKPFVLDLRTNNCVPITCTQVNEGDATRDAKESVAPLSSYVKAAGYVLTAEPGASRMRIVDEGLNRRGVRA